MLETIWFILWGVLWAVYFMLDGFDLGLGALLPVLARNESDKKIIYNSMGPFWDGNEVWLLTAGGVTFAAFPNTYAVMFSSLYSALMLILFALILRGVAIGYREETESSAGKAMWDICMVIGSFLPALLFGVAFANIFRGILIGENGVYQGTLFSLLNPYGLIGGVLFLLLFLVHGSLWLAVKSEGDLQIRAGRAAAWIWPLLLITAVLFLIMTLFSTNLYANYLRTPIFFAVPLLAVVGMVLTRIFTATKGYWKAWFASCLTIVSCTFFGVIGLYPNLLPSRLGSAYSMTIHNSASSTLTLKIMLGVTLVFVPIVIAYQAWVYVFFKDKATEDMAYGEG